MISPDFCRILNLSFWFRRIFGFADYSRYKNKAALQKEEQLYICLIYLRALFCRNLINTVLMTTAVKFGREELCQNHIRFFSADEALSLIHISEPTRLRCISFYVF